MFGRSPKADDQDAPAGVRGQGTRRLLLAAAAELVAELGWGAVSTRAVAQRAGVRPGVVHYHFRSVTDLLVDATVPVLAALIDEMVAVLEAAADLPSGVDALMGTATGYAADYAAGEPVSRLTGEAFLAANRVPRLQRELSAVLVRARARLAQWLRRGGFDGDAEATAVVLVAAFDGLILHLAVDEQTDLAGATAVLRALVGGDAQTPRS
jgi:AcrR family transcriptional regulator